MTPWDGGILTTAPFYADQSSWVASRFQCWGKHFSVIRSRQNIRTTSVCAFCICHSQRQYNIILNTSFVQSMLQLHSSYRVRRSPASNRFNSRRCSAALRVVHFITTFTRGPRNLPVERWKGWRMMTRRAPHLLRQTQENLEQFIGRHAVSAESVPTFCRLLKTFLFHSLIASCNYLLPARQLCCEQVLFLAASVCLFVRTKSRKLPIRDRCNLVWMCPKVNAKSVSKLVTLDLDLWPWEQLCTLSFMVVTYRHNGVVKVTITLQDKGPDGHWLIICYSSQRKAITVKLRDWHRTGRNDRDTQHVK